MIVDLASTSTSAINRTMLELRERGGAVALGRVLTLIISTDDAEAEEAIAAANSASRTHPCRVLVAARGNARGSARLDAQIRVGGDAGASEVIILRTYGELTNHPEAVALPLLLPDTPVVTWWPGDPPATPSAEPLGRVAQRRITDSASSKRPRQALAKLAAGYRDGDTDLAWSRLSRWRSLLAATLDQPPYEPVTKVTVAGASDSPSAELLAGWLGWALRCPTTIRRSGAGSGVLGVTMHRAGGAIELTRPERSNIAILRQPGEPERRVALAHRKDDDCISEELRRLDADEIYGHALTEGLPALDAATYGKATAKAGA